MMAQEGRRKMKFERTRLALFTAILIAACAPFNAATAAAPSGFRTAEETAEAFAWACYSKDGKDIFKNFEIEVPKDLDYHYELSRKQKIGSAAAKASALEEASPVVSLQVKQKRPYGDGDRAFILINCEREVGGDEGSCEYDDLPVHVVKGKDCRWRASLGTPFPPTDRECLDAYRQKLPSCSEENDGTQHGMTDKDGNLILGEAVVLFPGYAMYVGDDRHGANDTYVFPYPKGDQRIPDDKSLWNYTEFYKASREPGYPEKFEKSLAMLKAYEQAGYIKLREGVVDFDFYDEDSPNHKSKAKVAGVAYNLTEQGVAALKPEKISDDEKFYGIPLAMKLGTLKLQMDGKPELNKVTGFYNCPVKVALETPQGVNPEVAKEYYSLAHDGKKIEEKQGDVDVVFKMNSDYGGYKYWEADYYNDLYR